MNLDVQTDRTLIREAGKSTRYALLTFTAPDVTRAAPRPPLNVSFVIDRSGSMGGARPLRQGPAQELGAGGQILNLARSS